MRNEFFVTRVQRGLDLSGLAHAQEVVKTQGLAPVQLLDGDLELNLEFGRVKAPIGALQRENTLIER